MIISVILKIQIYIQYSCPSDLVRSIFFYIKIFEFLTSKIFRLFVSFQRCKVSEWDLVSFKKDEPRTYKYHIHYELWVSNFFFSLLLPSKGHSELLRSIFLSRRNQYFGVGDFIFLFYQNTCPCIFWFKVIVQDI